MMQRIGLALLFSFVSAAASAQEITGELRKWHRVTITFDGPNTSESATPNPFRDYRLDVTFTNGSRAHRVPGFYAADGNAATTSASSGNKWRVHFAPDATGTWTYTASFRTGTDVATSLDPNAGTATSFDGASGSFNVSDTNKSGRDHRGKGMLRYVGGRYYRFAETGEYFLQGGPGSPEVLLAYGDFDQTTAKLDWNANHSRHWNPGDPTWQGRGKGLIGAMNYVSGKGMNSVYFLSMNVQGDGNNVWPWTASNQRLRYDCSKLDQWEIVFSHMDKLGLELHILTQETENDQLIDGGALGTERRIYYRELIARFAHHLAIKWNLGEENTNTNQQRKDFARRIHDLDPYDHPVVVHTFPWGQSSVYDPLLGYEYFEGPSLQRSGASGTNGNTIHWIDASAGAGRPWVVTIDETSSSDLLPDSSDYWHDTNRKHQLWGNLMAGGGGSEFYFGWTNACNDLNCDDWTSRDHMWDMTRYALTFFHSYLPFWTMSHANDLTSSTSDFVLAMPGEIYAVYLPNGGTTGLQVPAGTWVVEWFDPRNGGGLQGGTTTTLASAGVLALGSAPGETGKDWVALVRRSGAPGNQPPNASFTANPVSGDAPLTVSFDAGGSSDADGTIVSYAWSFGGSGVTAGHTFNTGTHTVTLTVTDDDGATDTASGTITVASPPDGEAPTAPTNLTATAVSSSRIDLAWGASTDNIGVTGYRITRNGQVVGTASGTSYADTGRAPETPYTYTVAALDAAGNVSGESGSASATTPSAPAGPAVTGFVLVNSDTDQDIRPLGDGGTINLATDGTSLNIRAEVSGSVSSVTFGLDGNPGYRTESAAPYALAGDSGGDYRRWTPAVGPHTLTATPSPGTGLTITFTVTDSETNQPPSVNAGADQTIALPNPANLSGSVTDDGPVMTSWASVSGPGAVTFGNAGLLSTTASFAVPGTYVLRLTADDGELTASGEVTITVNPEEIPVPLAPADGDVLDTDQVDLECSDIGASDYQFRIERLESGNWNEYSVIDLTSTTTQTSLPAGFSYRWQCRAAGGAWSAYNEFELLAEPVPVHDVAITGLSANSPVTQGDTVTVSVEVTNEGNQGESNLQVSVTDAGTQTIVNLAAGDSTTLAFSWVAATPGTNTLQADVEAVPDETDATDNSATMEIEVQPPSTGPAVHVADISMTTQVFAGSYVMAHAAVTVVDQDGNPVSGAWVRVAWTGAYTRSRRGLTNSSGVALLRSSYVRGGGTFTVSITELQKYGYDYDAGANLETTDSVTETIP